jgi:ABC-type proline/glycine betaine transport system ATPase subunit
VEQAEAIERILQSAVQQTLSIQRRLGNPISIWKDGKVVIVPPEEIVISPEFLNSEK